MMLRGLAFGISDGRGSGLQYSQQSLHVAMSAQFAESPLGIAQRAGQAPSKLTAFHDAINLALKADARRPRHEQHSPRASGALGR